MKKRRWAALVLTVLMALQLSCPPAQAAGVYFVGAEENILPLTNDTMPFWYNGYLYVAAPIFTGTTRESLKISYVSTRGGQRVILYRGDKYLLYEQDERYGRDQSNNTYYPGAVSRNGVMFVPVATVADFFGLQYSTTSVRYGVLVWLRQPDFGLSVDYFADAASGPIQDRYNDYIRQNTAPPPQQPSVNVPEEPEISGKRVYLCIRGGEAAAELLPSLSRYGAQATFFCTAEEMQTQDDLLRRIVGSGHGIALLADAKQSEPVTEQLRAGNLALQQATGQKTRLARVEHADEKLLAELAAAGYCVETSGLEADRYSLESVRQANQLFQQISVPRSESCIWLNEAVQPGGLARFLSLAAGAKDPCLALTETTLVF